MASTVREKDIKRIQEAGYLAKKIGHHVPPAGQVVPTPEPHERVVFLPHFVRGLGFPLHPFVRGIMLSLLQSPTRKSSKRGSFKDKQ